jgi:hypothetical protein
VLPERGERPLQEPIGDLGVEARDEDPDAKACRVDRTARVADR